MASCTCSPHPAPASPLRSAFFVSSPPVSVLLVWSPVARCSARAPPDVSLAFPCTSLFLSPAAILFYRQQNLYTAQPEHQAHVQGERERAGRRAHVGPTSCAAAVRRRHGRPRDKMRCAGPFLLLVAPAYAAAAPQWSHSWLWSVFQDGPPPRLRVWRPQGPRLPAIARRQRQRWARPPLRVLCISNPSSLPPPRKGRPLVALAISL